MKDQLPIRVLLADNYEMVRYALAGIIHTAPDIELVAEASNRVEAVQLFLLCRPQVVVLDLLLPLKDGMSTIREIKAYDPSVQIIVLTSVQDEQAVCSALQAGAIGYLLKDSPMRDIGRCDSRGSGRQAYPFTACPSRLVDLQENHRGVIRIQLDESGIGGCFLHGPWIKQSRNCPLSLGEPIYDQIPHQQHSQKAECHQSYRGGPPGCTP